MKKLKLQLQEMKGAELLSREQLRSIVGGQLQKDPGGDCPDGQFWCTCNGSTNGCCASTVQECWDAC